jgi:hypothetical protein
LHTEYHIDGAWYPSVTTILSDQPKPWLDAWRERWGRRAEQKTRAATNIGTLFHSGAEKVALERHEVVPLPGGRVFNMLVNLDNWLAQAKFEAKEIELHVVSHAYKYAGTFDATGYINNSRKPSIFDWKTSSGIYADMALQLSAYAQAYKEQTGIAIKYGYIVHVSKDRPHHKLTVKRYTLGKRLFNKFLKRLKAFKGICPEHGETCMKVAA